jgi:hypothetical protein
MGMPAGSSAPCNRGNAVNFIDRTMTEDAAPADPQALIVFLQYALEDVRRLSGQSATHLEQAIVALANDIASSVPPRNLS